MGLYTHPGDDFTDDSDAVLLARCIFGEARGESEQGKLAVAFVVKNRVQQKGRTWQDVILQPKAFSCFNGASANYAALKDPEQADAAAWQECLHLAQLVVACNQDQNPIGRATHYFSGGTLPTWAHGHEPCAVIGHHRFYCDVPYAVPPLAGEGPAPAPSPPPRQIYRVQTGDTLSQIAQQFGVTLAQLLAANPAITDPNVISAGQEITIPT